MRTRTPVLLTIAALSVALVAPSNAAAVKNFRGKTQQGRTIKLTIGDDGLLQTLNINWITRRCRHSRARFQHRTTFRPPFDTSTPDAFSDAGAFTDIQSGGIRSRVNITLGGQRTQLDPADPATERWKGTLKASVVVRRRGKVIDRCTLRQITWTSGPVEV